jgi:flagellar basal body P-ring formation protein FlgA
MMTHIVRITLQAARVALIGAVSLASAVAADLGDEMPTQLKSSVTISTDVVRLGDIFSGQIARAEKVIGQAPAPGQRIVLAAEWLASLAKSNGVDWKPSSPYDRTVIFRPGQQVPGQNVVSAVRDALHANGLPSNYGLKLLNPLQPIMIAADAEAAIHVREAIYDTTTGLFSAVAEVAPGHSSVQFVQVRGTARAVTQVPQLKQFAAKDSLISAEMLEMTEVPEVGVTPDTVVDMTDLVGKSLRFAVRPGQQLRQSDIYERRMEKIPVLRADMRRGSEIAATDVEWVEMVTADIPVGTIKDEEQLIGKSPKRVVVAGAAIRDNDIATLTMIDLPIAARDVPRGKALSAEDLNWKRIPEIDVVGAVVRNEEDLVGRVANNHIRAGQPFRTVNVMLPVAMPKGKAVTLIFNNKLMNLTARGKALEDGAIGQVIRVTNIKSNQTVMAEVINENMVRVTEQQTAMN